MQSTPTAQSGSFASVIICYPSPYSTKQAMFLSALSCLCSKSDNLPKRLLTSPLPVAWKWGKGKKTSLFYEISIKHEICIKQNLVVTLLTNSVYNKYIDIWLNKTSNIQVWILFRIIRWWISWTSKIKFVVFDITCL